MFITVCSETNVLIPCLIFVLIFEDCNSYKPNPAKFINIKKVTMFFYCAGQNWFLIITFVMIIKDIEA